MVIIIYQMETYLNFPWTSYPTHRTGNLCHGWGEDIDYIIQYRQNTLHLFDFLKNTTPCPTIFICIGAAYEEIVSLSSNVQINQWRQLFPLYIEKFVVNGNKVQIIIISPNDSFMKRETPEFINKTRYMNWTFREETNCKQVYSSKKFHVDVYIFCTPMPSDDPLNDNVIQYIKSTNLYELDIVKNKVDNMLKTTNDIDFVRNFYECLKIFINKCDVVICNSYAVFNENDKLKNYCMFPEIKELFNKKDNKILSEWIYDVDNYNTFLYGSGTGIKYGKLEKGDITIELNNIDDKVVLYYVLYILEGDQDIYIDDINTLSGMINKIYSRDSTTILKIRNYLSTLVL